MNGRSPQDTGIEAQGLVREFKGGIRAVDGIDLRVEPGEIYGFLGPNGAGKSTTVHMLHPPPSTSGSAKVAGHDVVTEGGRPRFDRRRPPGGRPRPAAHRPRAHAPPGALHGIPKAERKARGEALIQRVGLTEAADRKVGGYSGGMKRRLDLALALLHGPRVLFLDEPTTGLDIQSRTALWMSRLASPATRASPSSSPPSTWRRPTGSPTTSGSSTAAGSSPGHPQALKAEVGRPTVEESQPTMRNARGSPSCSSRSASSFPGPRTAPPSVSTTAARSSPTSSAYTTRRTCGSRTSSCTLPASTTSSSPRQPLARGRTGRGGRGGPFRRAARSPRGARVNAATANRPPLLGQIKELARRSVMRTMRRPAQIVPATISR